MAAANILGSAFRTGGPTIRDLRRVQRRREFPTRITQAFQVKILRDLYPKKSIGTDGHAVAVDGPDHEAVPLRLVRRVPALRHLTGRFIGQGVRPEHVRAGPQASSDLGGQNRRKPS